MVLPEKAKRGPSAPVWNKSFPSPRRTCLKRLSGLRLPRFEIRVPSPRHCLSAAPSLSGATLLCHFLRTFPYPQPGDVGGCRSAPAGQLTATQLTTTINVSLLPAGEILRIGVLRRNFWHFVTKFVGYLTYRLATDEFSVVVQAGWKDAIVKQTVKDIFQENTWSICRSLCLVQGRLWLVTN